MFKILTKKRYYELLNKESTLDSIDEARIYIRKTKTKEKNTNAYLKQKERSKKILESLK